MKTVILLCGFYSLGFAIFHSKFWQLFNWKDQLKELDAVNRGVMQILNTRIIYFFLFTAAVCFMFPNELIHTRLGKFFLGGISLFWLGRAFEQFIFLRMNGWVIHSLTAVFFLGAALYALPLFF